MSISASTVRSKLTKKGIKLIIKHLGKSVLEPVSNCKQINFKKIKNQNIHEERDR